MLFLQADSRRSVEGFCKLVHSWESRSGGDVEALSGRQEDPQRQGENLRLYCGVSHCCWSGSEDDEGERGENGEGGAGEEEEGGGEHCFLIIRIVTFYAGCKIKSRFTIQSQVLFERRTPTKEPALIEAVLSALPAQVPDATDDTDDDTDDEDAIKAGTGCNNYDDENAR